MINLIILATSSAFATPNLGCDQVVSVLGMCEDDSADPVCVDARARLDAGVCDEQVVAMIDNALPVEPATVASAPVQVAPAQVVQPTPIQTTAPPIQPPVPPPVPVPPVVASITLTVVPATEQSVRPAYLNSVQGWQYVLPGASSPPVGADPAEQWAAYEEAEQWKAIHATDQKASAALIATDILYTTTFPNGGSQ